MIYTLPPKLQEEIDRYKNINLGGKSVVCPYYINLIKKKDLRVMLGKGTPEEIEMEAHIWEKIKGVDFEEMSEEEIRQFLIDRGIGIDCSGFVVHVLNEWHRKTKGKSIWKNLKSARKGFFGNLVYKMRPVENLGANVLTSDLNAVPIKVKDVMPGDVIRAKWKRQNAHHILLVSKVEKDDETGEVKLIEYTHSTPFYGKNNGVKTGQIEIIEEKLPLKDQKWTEVDENGVNFTYEGFMIKVEDNGLRRLKMIAELG
jgi:hypothetical protein